MIGQAVETEDSLEKVVKDPDFSQVTEGTTFTKTLGDIEDKIAEGSIEMIIISAMVTIEVGTDQEKEHSQEIVVVTGIEAQVIAGQGQDLEPVLIVTE